MTKEIWFRVSQPVGLQQLMTDMGEDLVDWWLRRRVMLGSAQRGGFDSLVLLVSWKIWNVTECKAIQKCGLRSSGRRTAYPILSEGGQLIDAGFSTLACVLAFLASADVVATSTVACLFVIAG